MKKMIVLGTAMLFLGSSFAFADDATSSTEKQTTPAEKTTVHKKSKHKKDCACGGCNAKTNQSHDCNCKH